MRFHAIRGRSFRRAGIISLDMPNIVILLLRASATLALAAAMPFDISYLRCRQLPSQPASRVSAAPATGLRRFFRAAATLVYTDNFTARDITLHVEP